MTNFNERTNTLLYKNIPLTLYSRKSDVSCVWEGSWRRGQTATYWPKVLLTIAELFFASWLGCSTVGHGGPKPSVWSWYSLRWHPISNSLKPSVSRLYFCLPSTWFRLFTQVHLLIDGSVEGQYVTEYNDNIFRRKVRLSLQRMSKISFTKYNYNETVLVLFV